MGRKKTFAIQTPEKWGGSYLLVGSPWGPGLGHQGRGRSTFIGCYQTVFSKHAGSPRLRHPPDEGRNDTPPFLYGTRVNDDSRTSMALVHASRTGIPNDHGRISKTNTPRGKGIDAKIRHGRIRLGTSRRQGLLRSELHRTHDRDQKQNWIYLDSWGGGHPEEQQAERKRPKPERESFSVPHASRDPEHLKDRDLKNEDIFEIIKNPPKMGVVRIWVKPEFWDTTAGLIKAVTTQGIATIHLPSDPQSLNGAQWHLLKCTLVNSETSALEINLQNVLTRQLRLDKDKKHRSFAWKILRTVKEAFQATKYQGDTYHISTYDKRDLSHINRDLIMKETRIRVHIYIHF